MSTTAFTKARDRYQENRNTVRTALLVTLFTAGFFVLHQMELVVVWLYGSYGVESLSVREVNWYLEPAVIFLYLTVGAHLLFDLRPAFDRQDPGVRQALKAAGIVYLAGFLFFAVTDIPFSLRAVGSTIVSAAELWGLFISFVVPITFAVYTEQDWKTGLKSAAYLTGMASVVPALTAYIEGAYSILQYTSTFAYLTDPLLEAEMGLAFGMLNGLVFASLAYLALRGRRRFKDVTENVA